MQVLPNKNEDSIWIKLKKDHCKESKDIFIGTYYVSPANNKKSSKKIDFFTTLNEEINLYRKKGVVLVQGDLNARTGSEKDFIEYDKFDEVFGIENHSNQNMRNSEDQNINPRGKELLDLCKLNDILIINGRKIGDLFGSSTSHQWNGSSVVDYFLAPIAFFPKISNFSVGQFVPWISDHCPIHITIVINELKATEIILDKKLENAPPRFVWEENSRNKFVTELNSPHTKERFQALFNSTELKPVNIAAEIKNILLGTARNCKLKTKKMPKQGTSRSEPWFDRECVNIKRQISKLGKELKRDPRCNNVRAELIQQKRSLKKLVTTKKRSYRQRIIYEMTTKKNQKKISGTYLINFPPITTATRGTCHIILFQITLNQYSIPQNIPIHHQTVRKMGHLITS